MNGEFTLTRPRFGSRKLEFDGVELAFINEDNRIVTYASPSAAFRKQANMIVTMLLAEEKASSKTAADHRAAEAERVMFARLGK